MRAQFLGTWRAQWWALGGAEFSSPLRRESSAQLVANKMTVEASGLQIYLSIDGISFGVLISSLLRHVTADRKIEKESWETLPVTVK